jgi:hypothetical protein
MSESTEQNLAAFGAMMLEEVKEAIREGGVEMDAMVIADKAVECGLMEYVAYDPAKHVGVCEKGEYEDGDMIYYWGEQA